MELPPKSEVRPGMAPLRREDREVLRLRSGKKSAEEMPLFELEFGRWGGYSGVGVEARGRAGARCS